MERDRFAWMIKLCKPTAAQEAELANCPFAREFENFEESSPLSPSQSPRPTPMTPILMVSPPPTQSSADHPPEHHADSHLEDRNPNDLRAEKVTILEAKRARVVAGEEFDGDTVPLSETEVVETEGDGGVGRTRVLSDEDLLIASWLGECYAANQAEAAARRTGREIGGLMNNGVAKLDAINVEGIGGEKPNESSDSSGSSESCEIIGYKSCETESGGFEKGVEMAKSAEKTAKDGRNGGARSNGKRNEKIDGRKRELSPSCKGKEKDAGASCEIVGYKCCKTKSAGFEKGIEIAKSAEKTVKDARNGGLRSNGKLDCRKRKLSPSCKGKGKVARGNCEILGYESRGTESGGFEKGFEMAKSAETSAKDGHGNEDVRSKGKKIIEKTDGKRRKLPPSCTGKTKDTGECLKKQSGSPPLKEKGKDEGGSSKKKNGLSEFSEFLDFLMKHFKYKHDDDEDDDYIATAKRRGMNFVEPRIWKRL